MLEIGSNVIVTLTNVEGVIVDTLNNEVLVKHKAEIDGITKTVCQWYDGSVVEEIGNEDNKSDQTIELGVIPQEEQDTIKEFHSDEEDIEE